MFRPDLGLRVRMAVALVLNAALLAGLLWLAYLLTVEVPGGWIVLLLFAMLAVMGARGRPPGGARSTPVAPRVTLAVSRLSLVADLPTPATVVVPLDVPLSWTTALPGRQPQIHVTTGLLDTLDDRGLEAVIAHELSHLGNHDAILMTILAAPGVFVLRALEVAQNRPDKGPAATVGLLMFWLVFGLPAAVSGFFTRIVSRHRELAADRGAALLTGSPAAVAAALRRLSDGLHAIPERDLRAAAAGDVLHIMPAKPEREIDPVMATHPSLERRLRELDRLEARLQA